MRVLNCCSLSGLSFSNLRGRQLLLYLQAAAAGGMMPNKRMRLSCVGHERAGKTTLLRCISRPPTGTERKLARRDDMIVKPPMSTREVEFGTWVDTAGIEWRMVCILAVKHLDVDQRAHAG